MDKSVTDFFLNQNVNIDLNNFIQNLFIALVLCLIVKYVYMRFSTSLSNKKEFSKNFVILGLTTCIVITIVKSSLALSLGLVGALSIVRFRAAIKEPEELVYLFLIIAIGLGSGAGQTEIVIVGGLVTLLIVIFFYRFDSKSRNYGNKSFHMSISFQENLQKNNLDSFVNEIKKKNITFRTFLAQ
tara:strand:- start:477 stop:1031 length:555 start_codon:yes stop_codon:yes gene_type:complete